LLIRNHGLSPGAFAGRLCAIVLDAGILGSFLCCLFSVTIATVGVVAITLNVPNGIRGLARVANVLATGRLRTRWS
jgi:hypothetical protein